MECMCAQSRPWFILSSERVLGMESKPKLTPKRKIPSTGHSDGVEEGGGEKRGKEGGGG